MVKKTKLMSVAIGKKLFKVVYNEEWGEWKMIVLISGKKVKELTYYALDEEDARDTMIFESNKEKERTKPCEHCIGTIYNTDKNDIFLVTEGMKLDDNLITAFKFCPKCGEKLQGE